MQPLVALPAASAVVYVCLLVYHLFAAAPHLAPLFQALRTWAVSLPGKILGTRRNLPREFFDLPPRPQPTRRKPDLLAGLRSKLAVGTGIIIVGALTGLVGLGAGWAVIFVFAKSESARSSGGQYIASGVSTAIMFSLAVTPFPSLVATLALFTFFAKINPGHRLPSNSASQLLKTEKKMDQNHNLDKHSSTHRLKTLSPRSIIQTLSATCRISAVVILTRVLPLSLLVTVSITVISVAVPSKYIGPWLLASTGALVGVASGVSFGAAWYANRKDGAIRLGSRSNTPQEAASSNVEVSEPGNDTKRQIQALKEGVSWLSSPSRQDSTLISSFDYSNSTAAGPRLSRVDVAQANNAGPLPSTPRRDKTPCNPGSDSPTSWLSSANSTPRSVPEWSFSFEEDSEGITKRNRPPNASHAKGRPKASTSPTRPRNRPPSPAKGHNRDAKMSTGAMSTNTAISEYTVASIPGSILGEYSADLFRPPPPRGFGSLTSLSRGPGPDDGDLDDPFDGMPLVGTHRSFGTALNGDTLGSVQWGAQAKRTSKSHDPMGQGRKLDTQPAFSPAKRVSTGSSSFSTHRPRLSTDPEFRRSMEYRPPPPPPLPVGGLPLPQPPAQSSNPQRMTPAAKSLSYGQCTSLLRVRPAGSPSGSPGDNSWSWNEITDVHEMDRGTDWIAQPLEIGSAGWGAQERPVVWLSLSTLITCYSLQSPLLAVGLSKVTVSCLVTSLFIPAVILVVVSFLLRQRTIQAPIHQQVKKSSKTSAQSSETYTSIALNSNPEVSFSPKLSQTATNPTDGGEYRVDKLVQSKPSLTTFGYLDPAPAPPPRERNWADEIGVAFNVRHSMYSGATPQLGDQHPFFNTASRTGHARVGSKLGRVTELLRPMPDINVSEGKKREGDAVLRRLRGGVVSMFSGSQQREYDEERDSDFTHSSHLSSSYPPRPNTALSDLDLTRRPLSPAHSDQFGLELPRLSVSAATIHSFKGNAPPFNVPTIALIAPSGEFRRPFSVETSGTPGREDNPEPDVEIQVATHARRASATESVMISEPGQRTLLQRAAKFATHMAGELKEPAKEDSGSPQVAKHHLLDRHSGSPARENVFERMASRDKKLENMPSIRWLAELISSGKSSDLQKASAAAPDPILETVTVPKMVEVPTQEVNTSEKVPQPQSKRSALPRHTPASSVDFGPSNVPSNLPGNLPMTSTPHGSVCHHRRESSWSLPPLPPKRFSLKDFTDDYIDFSKPYEYSSKLSLGGSSFDQSIDFTRPRFSLTPSEAYCAGFDLPPFPLHYGGPKGSVRTTNTAMTHATVIDTESTAAKKAACEADTSIANNARIARLLLGEDSRAATEWSALQDSSLMRDLRAGQRFAKGSSASAFTVGHSTDWTPDEQHGFLASTRVGRESIKPEYPFYHSGYKSHPHPIDRSPSTQASNRTLFGEENRDESWSAEGANRTTGVVLASEEGSTYTVEVYQSSSHEYDHSSQPSWPDHNLEFSTEVSSDVITPGQSSGSASISRWSSDESMLLAIAPPPVPIPQYTYSAPRVPLSPATDGISHPHPPPTSAAPKGNPDMLPPHSPFGINSPHPPVHALLQPGEHHSVTDGSGNITPSLDDAVEDNATVTLASLFATPQRRGPDHRWSRQEMVRQEQLWDRAKQVDVEGNESRFSSISPSTASSVSSSDSQQSGLRPLKLVERAARRNSLKSSISSSSIHSVRSSLASIDEDDVTAKVSQWSSTRPLSIVKKAASILSSKSLTDTKRDSSCSACTRHSAQSSTSTIAELVTRAPTATNRISHVSSASLHRLPLNGVPESRGHEYDDDDGRTSIDTFGYERGGFKMSTANTASTFSGHSQAVNRFGGSGLSVLSEPNHGEGGLPTTFGYNKTSTGPSSFKGKTSLGSRNKMSFGPLEKENYGAENTRQGRGRPRSRPGRGGSVTSIRV